MEKQTNYITYCRVSTKDQNISLDAQMADCIRYVDAKGGVIIGSYSEKASGKRNDRPELMKAIYEAQKQNATLLVAKLDRLTRNLSFWTVVEQTKINIEAINVPVLNALTVGVFLGLAQMEREMISTRTKRALKELKDQGVILGKNNLTSEGVKKSASIRHQKAKENTANKTAYAFVKILMPTTSKAEITRKLNAEGFRTPTDREWSPVAVANLIKLYND